MASPKTLVLAEIWGRSDVPIGDPAFTADGRLVTSHHPAFKTEARVSVFGRPDRLELYPDAAWNAGDGGAHRFDSVQGLRTDSQGVMWMADLGQRGDDETPKVVAWDTRADRHVRTILLPPPVTHLHSEPQDLVIDERRGKLYLADEGAGQGGDGSKSAIIVVDLESGEARRVLDGAACVRPEDIDIVVDGSVLRAFDEKADVSRNSRVGVDGIALDDRAEWLYFGPLNGRALYRVRAADLNDAALSAHDLEARVEHYAERPSAGGMWIDAADNLYMVEVEARAVGLIPASDRVYRRVAGHPEMLWPDGLIDGPDGWIYVTSTQLPLSPQFNGGVMGATGPFQVFRFKPPAV